MPRFAANLSMLWADLATPEARVAAAAAAGFEAVEILFVHDLDRPRLAAALAETGIDLVLFDAEPGDWAAGERGLLSGADEGRFRESIARAADHALELGARLINVLAGIPPAGLTRAAALTLAEERLAWACSHYGSEHLSFVVEALNPTDVPGYLLSSAAQAATLVRRIDSPWLGLQLDAYHCGMIGEDPRAALAAYAELVRHVQIADVPGRHEPGTGRLDLIGFLDDLDRLGYPGWVGCEFHPQQTVAESLTWMHPDREG